ncbi:Imm1 family immunity protein [Arhodomonas sp. AD133]|uniref:Imm1 family immunity protein n=1 Tax=Arhodomonas sp. AD133 TaxID=3415009 RepID=UPI003EB7FECD
MDEWLYELDEEDNVARSRAELDQVLGRAEAMPSGRLWVGVDGGPRPWWHRLVGLQPRFVEALLSVEWAADYASLIFHDENWSEYRAMDEALVVQPDEQVRARIAHGEARPHPVEECMHRERAFKAIRELIDTGARPEWLSYRVVK